MPQFINELETKFGDDKNVAKFVAEMKDLVEKGRASAGEATKKEDIQRIKVRGAEKREEETSFAEGLLLQGSFGIVCSMAEGLHG